MGDIKKIGNISEHRSARLAEPKWHWLLAALISALFWMLPLLILLNLGRGLDVADTGHYYNSLSQYSDIQSMSTQFFLFWEMLPIGASVYENRIWLFGLFLVAGGVFSFGLIRFLGLDYRKSPINLVVFLAVWSSVYSYYFWWLPDPSYNAVAIILLYALAGLVMWIMTMVRGGHTGRFFYILCFIAGFLLLGLALTRPTSTFVFLGLAGGFYAVNVRSFFSRRTLLLAGFGLLGGLVFLALVQIFVEPLTVTYDRQVGGLEMRQIRGRHSNVFPTLSRFFTDVKLGFLAYWPWLFVGITGAVFSQLKYIQSKVVKQVLLFMSCAGFIGMAAQFSVHFMGGKYAKDVEISTYLLVLALAFLAVLFFSQRLNTVEKLKLPNGWISVLVLMMILPYCFAFGTGNLWMKQSLFAGGFTIAACMVVLVAMRKYLPIYWQACGLVAVLLVPYSVFVLAQNKPYRLPGPLVEQTIAVNIRGEAGGTIYVDKATANYLNGFGEFYDQFGPEGKRAHLIDMSGMAPFLHYHLDAKLLTVPWLIATEKQSQATFEFILARMNANELRAAWVITAPDNKRHLDGAALRAIGLNFPDDYELVLTTRPPLSKTNIHLYRPLSAGE